MGAKVGLQIGALIGLLVAGGAVSAGAAPISGAGTLGSFTGAVTYTASSDTKATLGVSLTNTSTAANGGYITAFVLNDPNGQVTGISGFGDAGGGGTFGLLALTSNGINGSPNGQFDFGASTGNGFEGGGSPKTGIAVGASDSFTFALTGTGLLGLTADSFLTALSSGTGAGDGYAAFDVRFRGFANGGSDKVAFTGTSPAPEPGPGGTTPVPEPGSIALLGAGLAALGMVRGRRA